MSKSKEQFPLIKELPQNSSIMRLVCVGPVTRAAGLYSEPMWKARFRRSHQEFVTIHLAAPLLTFLPLGSLWQSQSMHNLYGALGLQEIQVEANSQSILWRTDENSDHFIDKKGPGAIPYILFSTPRGPFETLLVRCTEVIRFYFGASGLLSRFIFDFVDGASQNDALFFSELTGSSTDGSFVIAPSRNLRNDQEAHFIAQQLAYEPSRKSLALISSSARSLHIEKGSMWPVTTAPIEGTSTWKVTGARKEVIISEEGFSPQPTETFGVASIFSCSAPVEYPDIRILRPPTQKKPPSVKDPLLVPVARNISSSPSIKSTEAGKVPSVLEVRPMQDISDSRPSLEERPPQIVRSIEDHETGKIIRLAPVLDEIDELSALHGSGDDGFSGSLAIIPDGADPNKEWKKTTTKKSEPIDRSGLPSLFEAFEYDLPKVLDAPQTYIPSEFVPLIQAARLLANEVENDWAINIADQPVANLKEGEAYLYELPETWGPRVRCSKSPTNLRRALILRFESTDMEAAILDIEQRYKSEFAAYVILTRHPNSLTSALLAKVIHWCLLEQGKNKCWPTRETHSGTFWASRLQHSYLSEPHKRIRNKMSGYLEEFSKAANSDIGPEP